MIGGVNVDGWTGIEEPGAVVVAEVGLSVVDNCVKSRVTEGALVAIELIVGALHKAVVFQAILDGL